MVYCFNEKPVGFGENHNKNFNKFCQPKDIFIVCNPDIEKISKTIFKFLKVNCKDNILVVPKILNSDFSEADFRRQDLKLTHFLGGYLIKKRVPVSTIIRGCRLFLNVSHILVLKQSMVMMKIFLCIMRTMIFVCEQKKWELVF